jgi:glycosyltransferase involved in cell wall biosynthesis
MVERVLLLIDHLDIGGAQRHVLDLADCLRGRGHDVLVGYTGDAALPSSVEMIRVLPSRVERTASRQLDERVHAIARAWRPRIIHAHLFSSIIAATATGARLGIPIVATHHSGGTWQSPPERRMFESVLPRVARHLAASPQIAASLIAVGVPAHRVDYLPNAVVPPPRPAPARRGPGLRAGVLARLCPDKDPLTAVRAVAVARSFTDTEVTLRLGGDGELRAEVIAEIERLRLVPHVELCGPIIDVPAFMRKIDALLLSSRSEGTPLVVLEAMGHGRPVVATRVGGVPQQVDDGVTGMLVPAGDHAALGRALAWMADHPEDRLAMGRASRRRVIRGFSLDHLTGQVEEAYSRASLESLGSLAESAAS